MSKLEVAKLLLSKLMNDRIIVGCETCNEVFLDMKWSAYLPLLHGNLNTPTKWYNKVALHYCQYPEHQIKSNRDRFGYNRPFNFSEAFETQLAQNNICVFDLIHVVREMEEKLKDAPV
jgi:hypothetical protein